VLFCQNLFHNSQQVKYRNFIFQKENLLIMLLKQLQEVKLMQSLVKNFNLLKILSKNYHLKCSDYQPIFRF